MSFEIGDKITLLPPSVAAKSMNGEFYHYGDSTLYLGNVLDERGMYHQLFLDEELRIECMYPDALYLLCAGNGDTAHFPEEFITHRIQKVDW